MWVDTHTHLYLDQYDDDRAEVVNEALAMGVKQMFFPNIDENSIQPLLQLTKQFPGNCFPMMGLHPGSVKEDFETKLQIVESWLSREKFYGIGEIGIDLYWDKTFKNQQLEAFEYQLELAKKHHLPAIIHIREAFDEVFSVIEKVKDENLFGIFHCFTGTVRQATKAIELGFYLGIGGVVTFKNSNLPGVISEIGLEKVVLETDSPFLTPAPYRGKRNKSSYIPLIGKKIAEITGLTLKEVAEITTKNAMGIFFSREQ